MNGFNCQKIYLTLYLFNQDLLAGRVVAGEPKTGCVVFTGPGNAEEKNQSINYEAVC